MADSLYIYCKSRSPFFKKEIWYFIYRQEFSKTIYRFYSLGGSAVWLWYDIITMNETVCSVSGRVSRV